MVVHDNQLAELAKTLNSESAVVPSHFTFSTTDLTLDPSMASFTGEIPARVAVSGSRVNNVTTLTGIRSGAVVGSSAGETLYEAALFSASTSGTLLHMEGLPSILHTTNFDIELNWDLSIERD
jgi:hypothetical protein